MRSILNQNTPEETFINNPHLCFFIVNPRIE